MFELVLSSVTETISCNTLEIGAGAFRMSGERDRMSRRIPLTLANLFESQSILSTR